MLLTIAERFALSSVLPPMGDILTLKDIRQLKEELAISEEDREAGVQFFTEFKCPQCETKDAFPAPVKCGKCDVWLRPTGQIGCSNWDFTKEIVISETLQKIIVATLKQMNDNKKLEERHISIYERLVEAEEKEE